MTKGLDRGFSRRGFLKAGTASLAAGMAGPGLIAVTGRAAAQEPITLTFWTWIGHADEAVQLYEAAHPGIKVKLENVGGPPDYYIKLQNLIRAGSGLPDVGTMEYAYMPRFAPSGALINLSDYGADEVVSGYVPWAVKFLQYEGKQLGLPWDAPPLALIYRQDLVEQYGLELPTTWDALREQGRKLKAQTPDVHIINAEMGSGAWVTAHLVQGGWKPFALDGTNITIRINDDVARRFSDYWQSMIDEGLVTTMASFTPEWYAGHDKGAYAFWSVGAWGANMFQFFVNESAGKWRVTPIPQWDPAHPLNASLGGAGYSAFTQSAHPKEAAELAIWMSSNIDVATMYNQHAGHFPVVKAVSSAPGFADVQLPQFGGQKTNPIYTEAVSQIDPNFQWSPFQDFVFVKIGEEVGAAANGERKLSEAFALLQDQIATYASDQGFTVTT